MGETLLPIEDLISSAVGWQANQASHSQKATPPRAVSHAFSQYGRSQMQAIGAEYQLRGQGGTEHPAEHPNDLYRRLDQANATRLIKGWACIFDSQLAPCIMETPFGDWSTNAFLGAYNDEMSGLGFPVIRFDQLLASVPESQKAQYSDEVVTNVVSSVLMRERRVGHFFESVDNLFQIKPVALMLNGYMGGFHEAAVGVGQAYEQCLDRMTVATS